MLSGLGVPLLFLSVRRVMHVVERTIDKKGQILLTPEIELEGWWTSLPVSDKKIVQLYADHGTSEQFHSEFKTDLDGERLPSKLTFGRGCRSLPAFEYVYRQLAYG